MEFFSNQIKEIISPSIIDRLSIKRISTFSRFFLIGHQVFFMSNGPMKKLEITIQS